jgi:hypothetical protein
MPKFFNNNKYSFFIVFFCFFLSSCSEEPDCYRQGVITGGKEQMECSRERIPSSWKQGEFTLIGESWVRMSECVNLSSELSAIAQYSLVENRAVAKFFDSEGEEIYHEDVIIMEVNELDRGKVRAHIDKESYVWHKSTLSMTPEDKRLVHDGMTAYDCKKVEGFDGFN